MKKVGRYIVGVDEVGRGPLAGPVAVGVVVLFHKNFRSNLKKYFKDDFKYIKDSKKMTPESREKIFKKIKEAQKIDFIRYIVCFESNKVIDKKGISFAINSCIKKALKKLNLDPKNTKVLLDGGLKAPKEFVNQKTIIKGDDKELVISLASIAAKVSRDNLMKKLSKKYPIYKLEVHKGYGTKNHRETIRTFGASSLHRTTFCKNIVSA